MGQCMFDEEETACEHAGYPGTDTSDHDECWVGMDEDDDWGLGDVTCQGCSVGCVHCLDEGDTMPKMADSTRGSRFLRSSPMTTVNNRTARNALFDLDAQTSRLVQSPVYLQRAAVFDQLNLNGAYPLREPIECYGLHVCEAYPGPDYIVVGEGNNCPDADTTAIGGRVAGHIADAFAYKGEGGIRDMECRRFDTFGNPDPTVIGASVNGNTITLTAEHRHDTRDKCFTDALVPCAGQVESVTSCEDCVGFDRENGGFYNEGTTVDLFREALIDWSTARLRVPTSASPQLTAEIGLRNAVLAFVEGYTFPASPSYPSGLKFNRLDHAVINGSNFNIGYFGRWFDGTEIALEDLPAVCELPASVTRFGSYPVTAELVVVEVGVWMHLIAHRTITEKLTSQDDNAYHVQPHAVFTIEVKLGIRASVADGLTAGGELVEIVEGATTEDFPTVTPDGNAIMYALTEGVWIKPPRTVTWRGRLNDHSNPAGAPVELEESEVYGSLDVYCQACCDALDGFEIPGRATRLDSNPTDPNQTYTGEVVINWAGAT